MPRLRTLVTIHPRQKAFIPVDGCFDNINILSTAIKSSWEKRKEANIVLLDLAKAFDTVPHSSIKRAMRRQGVHQCMISVLEDLYEDATTTIKSGQEETPKIQINSGVKQGCPLSPTLFHSIMDELLNIISDLNTGISIGSVRVPIMAFADDLVLLSNSNADMEIILNRAEQFFSNRFLKVNASKCQSLRLLPVKGKKSMKTIEKTHRHFGGEEIPSVTYQSLAKYLGLSFNPRGNIITKLNDVNLWLDRIAKAALKPWQKCAAIRDNILPKLTHQLKIIQNQNL